jgi:hypothetical protein
MPIPHSCSNLALYEMVEDTGAAGEAVQHIALYVTTLKLDFARTCSAISLSSPLSGKVTQTFLGQIIVKCEMILKEAKLCPKFMRKDITEKMRNDVSTPSLLLPASGGQQLVPGFLHLIHLFNHLNTICFCTGMPHWT